ncbi:MAG: Crp/Fnr family transcriptional regulator [Burkholderiales bacterium]
MPLSKNLSLANRLIAQLPTQERSILLAYSELVELKLNTVLIAAGHEPEHAYFPMDGFVSVILPVDGSPDLEIDLVGNEGMFNPSQALGATISSFTCLVQGTGRAFRIQCSAFQQRLGQSPELRNVLNRYADVRASHLAQQVACIHYHSVEQRLARWLLMTRDRTHSSELFLTHEVLALMLGVRRESVTQAASAFQKAGLISYSRGYVMLLDESALLRTACNCYRVDLRMYERTLAHAS